MKVQIVTSNGGTWSGRVVRATPRLLTIRDSSGASVRIGAESIVRIYRIGA